MSLAETFQKATQRLVKEMFYGRREPGHAEIA
jgi:hypothetical protein